MALGYDLMPEEFKSFPASIDNNLFNAVLGTSQRTSTAGLQVQQVRNYLGVDGTAPVTTLPPPNVDPFSADLEINTVLGKHVVAASSGTDASTAFDKEPSPGWQSATTYDVPTGWHTGAVSTLVDGTAVAGEWIELTFPTTTVVNRINITSSSTVAATQSPRDFVVAAYVEGLWISVLQQSSVQGWTDNETRSFTFSATGAASEYRFITQGVPNASRVSIGELSFDTPPPYVIQVLEQRIANLIYKLYGVTNLEDAP
jgi:hypothetical protein